MHIPRIYHSESISIHTTINLSDKASNHVSRVLRMCVGQLLQLFDGSNQVFDAEITNINKKSLQVQVNILSAEIENRESPLHIHLGQVISRRDKMELIIQKSTELGVSLITPLFSERCIIKLDDEQICKKIQQWRRIVIAACEQCGRNFIPKIRTAMNVDAWCAEEDQGLKLYLNPRGSININALSLPVKRIRLLIGPESGLSTYETAITKSYAFTNILLGPRVLRTETATLSAISILQARFGDLN